MMVPVPGETYFNAEEPRAIIDAMLNMQELKFSFYTDDIVEGIILHPLIVPEQSKSARLSKNRPAAAAATTSETTPPTKTTRVPLGEITNLSDIFRSEKQSDEDEQQPRKRTKPNEAKKIISDGFMQKVEKVESFDDPQMCTACADDIYDYLHKLEMQPSRRPSPNYMEKLQKDIDPDMREKLVDWMVKVAEEYNLLPDTLYLGISYVDRFLSLNPLSRQRLLLLGVSVMLISSKYEEIKPPHVEEFCEITDNTFSKEEVVKMEAEILKALHFEMGSPTIRTFLRRFNRIAQEDYKQTNLQLEFLGYYLAELCLLDYRVLLFLPSLVAASVVFLSRFIIQPKAHPWNSSLQKYSGYMPRDLRDCVQMIHDLSHSRRGGSLRAIREKYNQHEFKYVTTMASRSPQEIPSQYYEDVEDFCRFGVKNQPLVKSLSDES